MQNVINNVQTEIAVFGSGCFWCTEAIFQRLKGVISVEPGYSGGHVKNPTDVQVYAGDTGHAEVSQITFDPQIISFSELLDVFFNTHDPTSLNKQGADTGPEYRSVIFYTSDTQKDLSYKLLPPHSVTEILPFTVFYPAANYHKNYFTNHPNAPYCQIVIAPKIKKLMEKYSSKI